MKTIKSQSVYLNITQMLLTDVSSNRNSSQWFTPSDAALTYKKLVKRYEKEGIGLLTKTLPRFCKALDRALSGQHAFVIQGFQKLPLSNLPKFLGEFTTRVFGRDGWLKPCPCKHSITTLRLITSLFKKLELPYEKELQDNVLSAFKAAEDGLDSSIDPCAEGPDRKSGPEVCDLEPTSVSDLTAHSGFPEQRSCPCKGASCRDSGFACLRECAGSAEPSYTDRERVAESPGLHDWSRGLCDADEQRRPCLSGVRRDLVGDHRGNDAGSSWHRGPDESGGPRRASEDADGPPGENEQNARATVDASYQTASAGSCASCSAERGSKLAGGFWDFPAPLRLDGFELPYSRRDIIDDMARLLSRLFSSLDLSDITPSHGSGAVSHGEKPWEKRIFKRFYTRLSSVYPYDQYFYWSPSHLCDELDTLEALKEEVPRSRGCFVPKDSRGPRLISCEPLEMMWIQQGMMRVLYKHIESHPLTRGCVQFTDQTVNNRLAREGSGGGVATLDLKEASDRVALTLVRRVYPEHILKYLEAARSVETELPNGEIVVLRKFAPMGSSLCFPILATTVWACVCAALMRKYGITNPKRFVGSVFVYGDDVIVPEHDAPDAIMALESIGLKVNKDKSYITGQFKESCGGFYFDTHDVSGISIRTPYSSRWSPEFYASWIDYSNQFYRRGYPLTAGYIADLVRSQYGAVPVIDESQGFAPCPALVHREGHVLAEMRVPRRWDKHLQRWEFQALALSPRKEKARNVGWCDILEQARAIEQIEPWPPIRVARHGNMHVRYLEVGSLGATSQVDGKSSGISPRELNPEHDYRWYTLRRASKLVRRWVSGGGLS